MIKNFSSCRSVALFSCPQSLNKGWSLRWNKLTGLQCWALRGKLWLGQHCCAQRVAHVWSPCSNMLLQGVVTFCSFITSYDAIQHYSKMLKCCVHLAAPLRASFILTCHGLRTFHATGVFSSLTFESNITGYRYKCSLWIGVFVVKSYHELLLSIMEFDKLIN